MTDGRPGAVLFDFFGTLVPAGPEESWDEQMRRLAEPLGLPVDVVGDGFTRTRPQRMAGTLDFATSIQQICAGAGVPVTDAQVEAAEAARIASMRRWMTPRDVTLPTLRRLRDAGVPLALVSDCSPDVEDIWPTTPMAAYFPVAVFSSAMGTRKPDPVMYATAYEALGVAPEHCMYVGDGNSNELTGAAALGIRTIHLDAERPERPGADYEGASWTGERITSLAELPALLDL
ncbi:MAG: HAD-IA family hydrolase [Streptosporangiales bacterium]|nr:HAD-IA family hydrolase [Streptosporangiales bacterium]